MFKFSFEPLSDQLFDELINGSNVKGIFVSCFEILPGLLLFYFSHLVSIC